MPKSPEVQVVVRWGASVVHVASARPADLRPDARRALGLHRLGAIPRGFVEVDTKGRLFIAGVELPRGESTSAAVGELMSEFSWSAPEDTAPAVPTEPDPTPPRPILSNGLSFGFHAALLAALWFFASGPDESEMKADRVEIMARLDGRAFRESEAEEREGDDGGADADHRDEDTRQGATTATNLRPNEGAAGRGKSTTTRGVHAATEGSVRATRGQSDTLADAREFGMIRLLREGVDGTSSGFGLAPPSDAITGSGNLWAVDMTAGGGGLGLSGVGEGGGGRGYGVGLGSLSVIGDGDRSLSDAAIDPGEGRLSGSHHTRGPTRCGCGGVKVSGRLPAETIQRVVRQNFGRFRGCWSADQLAQKSTGGRVSVAFTIGLDGAVSSVALVESSYDLPAGVRSCVARQFGGLSFPAPEGGVVRVTYPIVFEATP